MTTTLAGSAGLAALAAGCGASTKGNGTPPPPASGSAKPATVGSPAAAQPKRGGTLVRPYSLGGGATHPFDAGLDPHPLQSNYTSLMTLFYQTLLVLDPRTLDLKPELAQKWEQPDPTTYLFHLQPNVKFQDKPPANGRALKASDVVFSLDRVRTNDPRFQNRLLLAAVDTITAPDEGSVRLTLKTPSVATLTNLASFSVAILAPEVVEKAGKFATADTAVGTGAFVLQSLDDTAAVVVRNPGYWKPGLPYLDSVKSLYMPDQPTQWAAFLSSQVQVTTNPLNGPDAKKTFDEQQGKNYRAEWYKDVSNTSVQANVQHKPFDDPRVPHALRLMLDHHEASDVWAVTWFGRGYATAVLPAALDGWDFTEQDKTSKFLEFKQPKDDAVKQALQLLNAAGFSTDNPLKFDLLGYSGGFSQNEAELHQSQLNKFGQSVVQVPNLKLYPLAQANKVLAQGEFDYFSANLVPPAPYDVDSWFTTVYRTGGGRNNGKFSDPTLDKMFEKQRTITDVNQRKTYVKEILTYMIDHVPYTCWSGRQLLNVSSNTVHGWAPEGASAMWGYNYENVWLG